MTNQITGKHQRVHQAQEELGDLGQIFFTVRNPWDWCVSRWSHRKMRGATKLTFKDWLYSPKNFKRGVDYDTGAINYERSYLILRKSVNEYEKGAIVLRFENLKSDFVQIQDALDCHVPLPHINSSPHTHYTDFYTDKTRRHVKSLFGKYITKFEYEF